MEELSVLLRRARAGEHGAREALFAAAYPGLTRLAHSRLRHGGRNTLLDTSGLVHECFMRYLQSPELQAEDRRAFFAYASQVMRSIIVTGIRQRVAQKRGSGLRPLTLSTRISDQMAGDEQTVLQVHEALELLEQVDARLAQVVQMRYFGGYSEEEIAAALEVNVRTVQRLWLKARLMLQAALHPDAG
jgi:RNA polymerase sigma factor (TIGR02999 family)